MAQNTSRLPGALVLFVAILAVAVLYPPLLQYIVPMVGAALPNAPYSRVAPGAGNAQSDTDLSPSQAQMREREAELVAREYALAQREAAVRAREHSLQQDEARLGEAQRSLEEKESALDDERAALRAQQDQLEAERAELLEEVELMAAAWRDWETAMDALNRLRQLAQAERQEARAVRRWSLVAVGLATAVATLSVAILLRRVRCGFKESTEGQGAYLAGSESVSAATGEGVKYPDSGDGRGQPYSRTAPVRAGEAYSAGV